MKAKILFFGATADAAGTRASEIELEIGSTAGDIEEKLRAEHPALANLKLLIAVNEEYASPDTVLNDGDEVAIFTAVSGG